MMQKYSSHGYQRNLLSLSLDAAQEPYYFEGKYSHLRVVLPRWPCLALYRRALPVHMPPTTGNSSGLASAMTWVLQTIM
jgi:hypothetical protein